MRKWDGLIINVDRLYLVPSRQYLVELGTIYNASIPGYNYLLQYK